MLTVSKVAVFSIGVMDVFDVTAIPARSDPLRLLSETVDPPIAVQVLPSLEVEAVKLVPTRATWRYTGVMPAILATVLTPPPCVLRLSTRMPLLGVTTTAYRGADGLVLRRSMTPAFAAELVLFSVSTWARKPPSAGRACQTKWN